MSEPKLFPYIYNWDRQGRKGQFCRVITRGKSFNSAAVQFEDGYTMVTSRNSLRRRREFPNSVTLGKKRPADKPGVTASAESADANSTTLTKEARKSARKYPSLSDSEARSIAATSHEQPTAAKGHTHAI